MKELKIPSTKTSPEIILSPEGLVKISGRSIHEDVAEFYSVVEIWLNEYIKSPADVTCVEMNLEYFNSASAKVFIHLLERIKHVTLNNKKYVINWYYEDGDEDILERGEYFSSILDTPFNFFRIG
ncbi:MAG TPA: nuclear pore complex subunit [Bacteroidales bacterium]|nr:nuclear pore complex subunit [Bacteroidales bacterium]